MNKKSSIYILTGLLALSSITACKKDFLERPPLNQLTEEAFWKSEEDVFKVVNGVYSQLPGDGTAFNDGATDNAQVQNSWDSPSNPIAAGTIGSDTDAGWSFVGIRRANYFLENADRVKVIDPALLERYKAEVRFIRALDYFNLMSRFGDVPLFTKVLVLGEENLPRKPKKDVLKFVLSELDTVAKILPKEYAGGKPNEKGRITKGAALALTARVYLYDGQFQKAAELASTVMGMGYRLFTTTEEEPKDKLDDYSKWVDFADAADQEKFRKGLRSYERLFYQKHENNSEVILDRQVVRQKGGNDINKLLGPNNLKGWSSITPTQSMVDAYESYQTGEAVVPVDPAQRATWYENVKDSTDYVKEYRNRDPRFYASIQFHGAVWNSIDEEPYIYDSRANDNNNSKTGYNFRKLVDPTVYIEKIESHANVIIIRYAEILLTYAEAKNEVSGPDGTIYDALDQIRTRAGMPVVNRTKYATKDALREFIRAERRVELALEGHRYMDIRRWKIAPNVMKTIYDVRNGQVQQRIWTDKLYLMPIPQVEMDKSKGVLVQTLGY
ncbi:RagB/SusD family nutrient uptake outer membrane protein [Pedobacter gandavensis]|uniref:RagB/SusD family nutrient uptake outer membrane protein n=1 Tax=Pedobacter gandavensis TaxID=2679963 RepID=UPI00292DD857|nr:RagB/SusD family nutrient uptake outer membrane protein [Pedobacter gandavensis]